MASREFHYRWEYDLKSSPEQLWPFVADTNRFNRDTGVPSLEVDGEQLPPSSGLRRRLRLSVFGVPIEWEEEPFEWIRPARLSGTRRYTKGPVAELRVLVELLPRAAGGTKLIYQVWAKPKSPLGFLAIPIQIGMLSARRFGQAYEKYDELVASAEVLTPASGRSEISTAVRSRLNFFREKLVDEGVSQSVADQLVSFVENAGFRDLAGERQMLLIRNCKNDACELWVVEQALKIGGRFHPEFGLKANAALLRPTESLDDLEGIRRAGGAG